MSHSEGRRGIGEGQDLVFKRDLAFLVRSFCPIVMKIRTGSSDQIVSSVTNFQSIPIDVQQVRLSRITCRCMLSWSGVVVPCCGRSYCQTGCAALSAAACMRAAAASWDWHMTSPANGTCQYRHWHVCSHVDCAMQWCRPEARREGQESRPRGTPDH